MSVSVRVPYSGVKLPRRRRRGGSGAALIAPVGLAGSAAGIAAAQNPLIGAGMGGLVLLSFLPWTGLFAALVGTAIANRAGYDISGLTLRIAQAVLVPFTLRAFLLTNPSLRPRWRAAEWTLIAFVVVQYLSSWFYAVNKKQSIVAATVESIGAVAYLAIFTSVVSPERLRKAARVFLTLGALGAVVGMVSLAGYYVGSKFGVDLRYRPIVGGAPTIKGLAYEHNIFGSTCAAVAMAFFILYREQSTLYSRKWTFRLMWISIIGMLIGQSRGPWLGFAAVLILYFVFKRRRVVKVARPVRAAAVLLAAALLSLAALYLVNQSGESATPAPLYGVVLTFNDKVANILNTSSGTGAGRLRLWDKGTTEVIQKSPLIGLGTYSYGQRNFRPSPHTAPYLTPGYLISLWVRTLYDTGFLGLVLLASFMGLAFWPRKELQHSSGDLATVARALSFASMVLAASYLITDSTLLVWPWLLFGLARAAIVLAVKQAHDLDRPIPVEANGSSRGGTTAFAGRPEA
jgi:hypothetical protein